MKNRIRSKKERKNGWPSHGPLDFRQDSTVVSQDRSLSRQNPQPRNCSDHALVRLITLHYKCIKLESNYVGCGIRCEIRCRFATLISLGVAINNSKTGLQGEDDVEAKRRGDVRNLNTEVENDVRVIEGDWRQSLYI